MKRLIFNLLAFSAFTPTLLGQTLEQKEPIVFPVRVEIIRGTERQYENVAIPAGEQTDLQKIWSGWLQKVEVAERDYKNKNGRYGDLAALRKAHLLRSLVFEPCSSAGAGSKARISFIPKSTLIQVTVSEDGQDFDAVIVDATGRCYRPPDHPVPPPTIFWDSPPQGPILPG
ncbi:MAG TPA: hypothetical protein VJS37_17860 [Terriglobales bacterium]|nr:hypothetical protein [Terriglobales bacterium]